MNTWTVLKGFLKKNYLIKNFYSSLKGHLISDDDYLHAVEI